MLNKSLLTNGLALALLVLGYLLNNDIVISVAWFAISGAITNWLAVHMLFEKVPGLYGSGVIPERFEDFKQGIRHLLMEQFFSIENIKRFLNANEKKLDVRLIPIIEKVDLSPTFDALIEVIKASSFGQMLGMFGGVAALEPMRQPFVDKMRSAMEDIVQDPVFLDLLHEQLSQADMSENLHKQVAEIVQQRLDELSPQMVKDIIQQMIKQHLGWLVVWGGVFGGLIGLLAATIGAQ
jgi:uncharacterized membrane protein YheB (UPF0754 family)